MVDTLDPNIDAYGRLADASALADWCELHAAANERTRESDLQDLLDDNGWTVRGDHLIHDSSGGEELDSRDSARSVFAVIEERQRILGAAAYPFRVEGGTLRRGFEMHALAGTTYYGLLAIAVAHAWDLEAPVNPRDVFEDTVARALQNWGFRAVNFGQIRRGGGGSFEQHVVRAGVSIDLSPTPERATRKLRAQDAGCDCIISFPWEDGRVDRWVAIGQVTCGESASWEKKLAEIPLGAWGEYLGLVRPPRGYLAVPHHIEQRHFTYLVERDGRSIVDRLRLARRPFQLTADEQAIAQHVASFDVMELS